MDEGDRLSEGSSATEPQQLPWLPVVWDWSGLRVRHRMIQTAQTASVWDSPAISTTSTLRGKRTRVSLEPGPFGGAWPRLHGIYFLWASTSSHLHSISIGNLLIRVSFINVTVFIIICTCKLPVRFMQVDGNSQRSSFSQTISWWHF